MQNNPPINTISQQSTSKKDVGIICQTIHMILFKVFINWVLAGALPFYNNVKAEGIGL